MKIAVRISWKIFHTSFSNTREFVTSREFISGFVSMLKAWEPFNEPLHDPHLCRSSVDFHSDRFHCLVKHALMYSLYSIICAVLLYILYCIDSRFLYTGFSLYMALWHGYNLFAFRFFDSDEIFTFEYFDLIQ